MSCVYGSPQSPVWKWRFVGMLGDWEDQLTRKISFFLRKCTLAGPQFVNTLPKSRATALPDLSGSYGLAPCDSLACTRQQYRHCTQRPNETIEQYYLRFTEIVNKLDKKPEESWQVSDFVEGLDAEHAELLAKYGDISTYEGVTVQEVRSRLTRTLRLKKAGGSGVPKGPEQRVSTKSKPHFKTTTKNTTAPLHF